jgi:alpha-tubulin suppressor-like RCC1 family protein
MQQVNAAVAAGTWPKPPALYAWGANDDGQLGLGNRTYYSSPKQVGSATWTAIGGTNRYALGVQYNGTLWAWGNNNNGCLGVGNTTKYSSPKQVGALTNWLKVSSGGYSSSFAIKTDGTFWSWGDNGKGQLGDGTITKRSSPVQVGSLTNWLNVASGAYYVVATKTDGTLWSWGGNTNGQLGLGNRTSYSSPKQVGALTNWLNITCSQYSTLAVKTDGSLWSWGQNDSGQLGLNNRTYYSSPKQVGSLTTWSNGFASQQNGIKFFKTDGTLWTWGNNSYGELGLGNTTKYSSPKQVGSLTTWSAVSGKGFFTIALQTNGTLWSWGRNADGQLGLGNTTSYSSPKQIGSLTSWVKIASGYSMTFGTTS